MAINVVVNGAAGRMGREVVKAIGQADDMSIVGACDQVSIGEDAGSLAGIGPLGIKIQSELAEVLVQTGAQVMVDFTEPASVLQNVHTAIRTGVRVVVGTTGLTQVDLEEIDNAAYAQDVGVLVAPNFAIGAVLMMHFAQEAARWFPHVEIIELHHEGKKDAPSGTALKTAEVVEKLGWAWCRGNRKHYRGMGKPARGPRWTIRGNSYTQCALTWFCCPSRSDFRFTWTNFNLASRFY